MKIRGVGDRIDFLLPTTMSHVVHDLVTQYIYMEVPPWNIPVATSVKSWLAWYLNNKLIQKFN